MVATTSTKPPGRSVLAHAFRQGAEAHGAIDAIDAGVLGHDLRRDAAFGHLRRYQRDGRAGLDRRRGVLGQGEIHIGVIADALQHGDGAADIQIGAGLQVGQADAGAERRQDCLLVDAHLQVLRPGVGGGQLLLRFVQLLRGYGLGGAQLLAPLIGEAGQLRLGFGRIQARLLLAGIEADQQLAGLDDVAGLEADLRHRARQFVADLHLAQGHHGAHGPGARGPFAAMDGCRFHGLLRLRKGGAGSDRGLNLRVLVVAETADNSDNRHNDYQPRHRPP